MRSGNKWIKETLQKELTEHSGEKITGYYRRKLETIHEHYAHIFFCEFENQQELLENWKHIVNLAALHVQSDIVSLLERSNFYVWFFVKGKVLKSLQKNIEDDTYSSKKYIVSNTADGQTEEERLELAENRLFAFSFQPPASNRQMIQSVVMKNFRSYKGTKTFYFGNAGQTARLVVLFAPNGMGKTSFFDGVEWNLTETVDRFREIGNKSISGEVLRNTDADEKEEAFVCVSLEKGDSVKRIVSPINGRTKKDIGKGSLEVSEGNELEGLLGDSEVWKNLMLQHHKIDGFIAAAKPQELYREWGGLWDPSGEKRKGFEQSHKNYRQKQKELEAAKEQENGAASEYDNVNAARSFVDRLSEDTGKLIKFSGEKKGKTPDFAKMSASEYIDWSDQVDIQADRFEKELEQNRNDLKYVETELLNNIETFQKSYIKQEQSAKELSEIKEKLIQCRKKKELIALQKDMMLQKEVFDQRMKDYRFLSEQGEEWYRQGKRYFEAAAKLKEYKDGIASVKKELIPPVWEEQEKLKAKLGTRQTALSEEIEYKQLCKHLNELGERKKVQEELKNLFYACEQNLDAIEKSILETEAAGKRLQKKSMTSFHEALEKYHTGELSQKEEDPVLEKTISVMVQNITVYLAKEQELAETDQGILREEKVGEELRRILEESRKFISKHQAASCPVCHTMFEDADALIQSTFLTDSQLMEKLIDQRRQQEAELLECKKKVIQDIESYYLRIMQLAEEADNLKRKQQEYREAEIQKKESLLQQQKENEAGMIKIERDDRERGIYAVYTKEGIENWHENWRTKNEAELMLLNQQMEENAKRLSEYANMIKMFEESIETEQKEVLLVESGPRETFLKMKQKEALIVSYTFAEIKETCTALEKEENDLSLKQIDCEEKLKTYQEYAESMEPLYRERELVLQEDVSMARDAASVTVQRIRETVSFPPALFKDGKMSDERLQEIVQGEKERLVLEKQKIAEVIEILNRLKYNHEVENYFLNWEKVRDEVKEAGQKKSKKEEEEVQAKEAYWIEKMKIDRDMQEFLNQFQINDIYEKLEPHEELKTLVSEFGFNDDNKPELFFKVTGSCEKAYPPEWYFSTAQLNVVAFSVFLGRALQTKDAPVKSILIDDPVGHFDEMNVVGFVDLLRNILEHTDRQLIISTHEEQVFGLMKRKIPEEEYPVCYIDFRKDFNTL